MTEGLTDYGARTRRLRMGIAIASAGAAAIHVGTAPAHLDAYAPAGVFMLACGAIQVVIAVAAPRMSRRLVEMTVWFNAGIVVLWVMSRTVGVPFGATPWVAEHIHGPDVLATVLELIAIAAGVMVMHPLGMRPSRLVLSLAVAGALLCPVVGGDDPARERPLAAATLLFAAGARGLIVARARSLSGREDAQVHRGIHAGAYVAVGRVVVGAGR